MNTIFLASTLYWKQPSLKGKAMLLYGLTLYPIQTFRWLRFLHKEPMLWQLAESHPQLILKIYRPYLSKCLSCTERVKILSQHYGFLLNASYANLVRHIALHPKVLCEFFGKSGTAFQLELVSTGLANREGEFMIHLVSNKISIYRIAFSFLTIGAESYVKIGCVQGIRAEEGAILVRATTHDLHGCRPKNLMVSIVRDIGDYFGCHAALGVSNKNKLLAQRVQQKSAPDYDATWDEIRAIKRDDGDYQFSCKDILKINFDAVPSRKRSEARKRNQLLGAIFQAVRHSFQKERSSIVN